MIPTAEELENFTKPFDNSKLTLTYGDMSLIATRLLTYDTATGRSEIITGYSARTRTDVTAYSVYVHVYMPASDRLSADVLHGMIRHAAEYKA